jgi:hypothetical protein
MLKKQYYVGLILSASLFSTQILAFPCFITLVKGSCWKDYEVNIDVLNAEDNQVITTIKIPKGKSWTRESFEAKTKQRFMLRATFTPSFWKTEDGVQYYAKKYWSLPETVEGETVAWNVGACFSSDFASVPMPPETGSNCACDKKEIPQLNQDDVS